MSLKGRWFHYFRVGMGLCASIAATTGAEARPVLNARDPNPLMPHPPDRPIYSQDKFKREQELEGEQPPPLEPPPTYSQDKYDNADIPPDYSDELRKAPEKGREWSEIEIAKGNIELNSSRYNEAEKHFNQALAKDPRNFVAMEYLGVVQERRGDLRGAISWLAKAKHLAPEGRWGSINFQIGRVYMLLRNDERAEVYLRLAIKQGAQLTAAHYSLGYIYYNQEKYFEAETHLHEAKMRAQRRTALIPERDLLQAINYYLGEIYARLGFAAYSIVTLRQTEIGPSWEVRNTAWRVHSEINQSQHYLSLGFFGQFDSNVVLVPQGGDLPIEFSSAGSAGTILSVTGGWRSSPAKKWSGGVDAGLYMNNHLNKTLGEFDVINIAPTGWVQFWNQRDWSFTARYELNHSLTDRRNFSTFQSVHGPGISANYFPFQRWNWEFGMAYRINTFATDTFTGPDRRSGHTYVGYFKASLKAPNPRFRPSFAYTFEGDAAEGENFQSRSHIFAAEGDWRLLAKTHLVGGFTYQLMVFPNHVQGRSDRIGQTRIGLYHILSDRWLGIVDIVQIQDSSTLRDFSFSRVIATVGATYTF